MGYICCRSNLLVLFASFATVLQLWQPSFGQEPWLEHFDAKQTDPAIDPCDDFFKYADGKWIAAHPIPPDQSGWGVARSLQLWNETLLRETMQNASAEIPARTSDEQKVGNYYYACMDEKTVNAHAAEWLQPELERIAEIKTKSEIAGELAHLHQTIDGAYAWSDNQTPSALFGFSAVPDYDDASHNMAQFDQGGMSLPSRSFYLEQDAKSKDIRARYLRHVQNMFVLAGEQREQAKNQAEVVLTIETELAKAAMDPVVRRDPKNLDNKMKLEQIKALTPSFDWDLYLKTIQAPATSQYLVTTPNFFKNLETMLQHYSLDDWKTYLRWQMLHGNANALSVAFVDEDFDFFSHTLFGTSEQQPRWRRCIRNVGDELGEVLGKVYVERAFSPESKQRVIQMVHDIEAALARDIEAQNWTSEKTKKQAQEKLRATLNKVGYPDKWRDYSSVKVSRDSYLRNQQNSVHFEFERWVAKIGQPVDRTEWAIPPFTINAYENPQDNTINVPAGILHPPFFDPDQDDAVNYGAIGAVIGHELIHGFDDQGRKFDAQGNLRDWWNKNDAREYEARDKCISDEYTQEVPEAGPGVRQNGRMTLGEDTADNGGLHLAFIALEQALARKGEDIDAKEGDGLTPRQRFFLAFAFEWAGAAGQEGIRTLVLTNPHSYRKYRVNNVVSNMPEFWQAFDCHKGQRMVREKACRIW
jgi:endothelin-converting enzyme/putative endopeptidase